VFPAVLPLVVPQFVLATKTAIMLEASLAFLGLGDITAKSWGTMLSLAHARSAFLTDAWIWWVLPPGLAIALTVVAFALLGHGIEERARPSLRGRTRRGARRSPRPAPRTPAVPAQEVPAQEAPVLEFEDLTVAYRTDDGWPRSRSRSTPPTAAEFRGARDQRRPQQRSSGPDRGCPGRPMGGRPGHRDQARSNRSRFMTLSHAATKSRTNFSFASWHA
jgi:hypothetical protein